jgi:hypothetical protein
MYIGNLVGLEYRPHSESECVNLVKLCQTQEDDQAFVQADIWATDWFPGMIGK